MLSHTIGSVAIKILRVVVSTLTFLKVKPNHLTTLGVIMCVATGFAFAKGDLYLAGWLLIVAGFFDMVDAYAARKLRASVKQSAVVEKPQHESMTSSSSPMISKPQKSPRR